MNVTLFAPYARYITPHFETELEIAECHLAAGDAVTFLACHGELDACDVNPWHGATTCAECISRGQRGMQLLTGPVRVERPFTLNSTVAAELQQIPQRFPDLESLKTFRLDQFDIGYAALSSLVTITRDPDVDLVAHADLLRRLLRASWLAYRSVQRHLHETSVDRLYVFNGRFAPLRAALRACQAAGIECLVHERGHDLQHYALFLNTLPHDLVYMERQIREAWDRAGPGSQRTEIARQWYEKRARGAETNFKSFVTSQQVNCLPDGWNREKTNVAIFTSSEDEFVAIGDSWQHPFYPNQLDGLRAMLNSLSDNRSNLHLYLRMHPNLAEADNRQTRAMRELSAACLTVIPPEDPVSTYDLMREVDKVVSFGSTAGIEAAYWGTPSILAGTCYYRELGATYNPATHGEVMRLMTQRLAPLEIEGTLMFGHYFGSFGEPFRHFHASGVFSGTFKGTVVRPGSMARTRRWLVDRPASVGRKLRRIRRAVGGRCRHVHHRDDAGSSS
ncbi:MAG: hypothetical protein ACC628_11525 [Pirellulaceae bacterium]